ncbi:lysine transporter LysM [Vibrio cincinnatiensis]|uniref:LysM-like peptidoglycan-binding domain-containing protein n=1 Tax=Vibrio cincinnatiensis TaxID=675 RepID=UPI001EE0844A|nr:LysM-like peptidoglycan-binding domain-containing protein [Vibrio cincinnatiensis]MCG3766580.1 lysine transporter LysM [Vibrio cincinnatiensis]
MNRRHKKKQQTDYLALMKRQWLAIEWQKTFQHLTARDNFKRWVSFWQRLPIYHQRALMVLIPLVVILLIAPWPSTDPSVQKESPQSSHQRVAIAVNTQGLSEQNKEPSAPVAEKAWHEYIVKQGDTLSQVFRSNGLSMSDLNALVQIEGGDKPLSQIQRGQLIRFKLTTDGQLDILQLEKNNQSVMFFRLSDGGFGRSK